MTESWEERERKIDAIFIRRLKDLMKDSGVNQKELARRVGGGIEQPHISRWFSPTGSKLKPGTFGTAVRALGGNPADEFSAVIGEAQGLGLLNPRGVMPLTTVDRGAEASDVDDLELVPSGFSSVRPDRLPPRLRAVHNMSDPDANLEPLAAETENHNEEFIQGEQ